MSFYSTSSFRCSFALCNPKLQPLVSMSLSSKLPLHFSGNARFNRNHVHHHPTALRIRASNASSSGSGTNLVLLSSTVTVTTAVANRVLYKLALVPMKEYPFFLAQFITFGYVVIYFSILYIRYRARIVTDEMMAIPKLRFVAIGLLEALGLVAGMSAGALLPGPVIPILNQYVLMAWLHLWFVLWACPFIPTKKEENDNIAVKSVTFLVWQLMFSSLLLKRKYTINQLIGCLLVASGVIVAITSGSNAGQMLSDIQFFWPALMIISCAFQALASVIKEYIFIDSATRLKHKSLDIFVVNSFGSGFQALFVFLSLPLLSKLKGIPFAELPSYFKSGAGCFLGKPDLVAITRFMSYSIPYLLCTRIIDAFSPSGCDGAPLLPLLYIITNLAFNISLLNAVKTSSAVVSSLLVMLSVPISVYILSLPLPYLPEGTSLSPFFLLGCGILLCGLLLYNTSRPVRNSSEVD
ncbi:Protein CLT2-like protein [Vigna angularis]|uniref:Protein CLT2-like protein n=1 Tax=Phaseolus angularis TaxID=3914 RepID=A0A8T0KKK4_PHAAN|nr:Protein CLT2-like protein [Vigna angularis]